MAGDPEVLQQTGGEAPFFIAEFSTALQADQTVTPEFAGLTVQQISQLSADFEKDPAAFSLLQTFNSQAASVRERLVQDIHANQQAEEALAGEEISYSALFESVGKILADRRAEGLRKTGNYGTAKADVDVHSKVITRASATGGALLREMRQTRKQSLEGLRELLQIFSTDLAFACRQAGYRRITIMGQEYVFLGGVLAFDPGKQKVVYGTNQLALEVGSATKARLLPKDAAEVRVRAATIEEWEELFKNLEAVSRF